MYTYHFRQRKPIISHSGFGKIKFGNISLDATFVQLDLKGNVKEYKSRLIAKGFTHKFGVDFHESFAPNLSDLGGAILIALKKPDSEGVRPIAIGETIRRITAKVRGSQTI
jgi:hypothetical protein